jgi:A/G-specific adenine glycosylase
LKTPPNTKTKAIDSLGLSIRSEGLSSAVCNPTTRTPVKDRMHSPLPKGEGKGEGKGDIQQPEQPRNHRGSALLQLPIPKSPALQNRIVLPLLSWFAANARDLPWRRTNDPYAIWVSEIMLQQTQVKTVIPFWNRWMRELPDLQALAQAPAGKIHKLWEGLGYYTRVRNLQNAAQTIVGEHHGQFPTGFDDILALPGIGRYTAGAISSIAFNQPTPILDGNVMRVLTRLMGIRENPREKTTNTHLWHLAQALVTTASTLDPNPNPNLGPLPCSALNQALMELGALICTPRQPKCAECPVRNTCIARRKGLTEQIPNLDKRAAQTERTFFTCVIHQKGKYLIRQRPTGVVNAHLWEFPNIEFSPGESADPPLAPSAHLSVLLNRNLNPPPPILSPLEQFQSFCEIRHSITRYRITQKVYLLELSVHEDYAPHFSHGKWCSLRELNRLPFTAAHAKIRKKLAENSATPSGV